MLQGYYCDTCDHVFGSRHAAEQHMDALSHWGHPCDTCDHTFASETSSTCIWMHMNALDHWDSDLADDDSDDESDEDGDYNYERYDRDNYGVHHHGNGFNMILSEGTNFSAYCHTCKLHFYDRHNLCTHISSHVQFHVRGRGRNDTNATCPFCKRHFTTASGLCAHVESSGCLNAGNLHRANIHNGVRHRDPHGRITEQQPQQLSFDDAQAVAESQWNPQFAWNGTGFECYVCHRSFVLPDHLRQHVYSPAHQQPLYHCPNKDGLCAGRQFTTLAGLFNHLEGEACNYMRFEDVQKGVQGYIDSVVKGGNQGIPGLV